MAVFLNNNVGVKINSVDLSDHVTAVTINRSFDELEVTAMGDSSHKFVKGLEASTVTIDFLLFVLIMISIIQVCRVLYQKWR